MNTVDHNKIADFDPFAGDIIEKIVPATEPQKEIFASCIIGGRDANLAYNESLSLFFIGSFNEDAICKAITDLQKRHESLRATFTNDGSKMIIYESKEIPFYYFNLEGLDISTQEHQIEKYNSEDALLIFSLFDGPLIRVALFRLETEKYALTITAHHIICDGWSFGILLEDLSRLYNYYSSLINYPAKPLLFSDYVVRSAQFEQSAEYRDTLNYWKNEYKGEIPTFEIPPDFPRPTFRTYRGRRDDFILSNDIADSVKRVGAKYGCGLVTTLMSVFEILLYKYTGNSNLIIGLPTSGQSATEMYDLIGHCVNFLPLRSNPDPNLTFGEYLKQRKSKTLNDYEHQQFTFGTLLKELKIERDASRIPLSPISFNIDIGMNKEVVFDNLTYRVVYNKRIAETFEVFLNIADCNEGYEFQWSYNTQLYKPSTIAELMDKYLFLLTQLINNPTQGIKDLKLEDDKRLVSYWEKWNNNTNPELYSGTILDKLNNALANYADQVALYFKGQSITYKELFERSNRLANYLINKGISVGTVVGIAMERGIDVIVSILGVIKAGGVFVPLDPQYAPERIEYMLENAQASLLLTTSHYAGKFQSGAEEICVDDIKNEVNKFEDTLPEVNVTPDSLVYILYTSGSTGKPKGVMIANQSLVNYISWAVAYYLKGKPGVFPLYTSISFDLTITSIFSPLVSGSSIKIFEELEPVRILEKIFSDKDINVIKLTPSHLKLVSDNVYIKNNLSSHHKTLIVGGEQLETSVAKSIYDLFNGNVTICNEYGPTEATVGCMIHDFSPLENESAVPIGVPISNARIYLLDKWLNYVPKGVPGEIYIGGICVSKGYYNNVKLTQERFLDDPFVPGVKMYKTGDMAVMQDSDLLLFKGRTDDQVKIRGYRIELGEIDYHILSLKEIKNAATIVWQDALGNASLVSYVTLHHSNKASDSVKSEWRDLLRTKLPDYMVPSIFMILEELPLTLNGKIDKKRLPTPEAGRKEYVAPQTAEEIALAGIWSEVFGKEKIGVYDNFFELGGHSLIAVKVMNRMNHEMNVELPIATLFQYSTINSLAKVISSNIKLEYKTLVPIKKSGSKPPIYLVHGGALNILLYKNLEPFLTEDQPLYGIQALGLDGDLTYLGSIESIATRYLKEVLIHNPDGPYILVGYSYSGLVVYEMALQLKAMGKEVKMLGILDTNISNLNTPKTIVPKIIFNFKHQIKKMVFIGNNLLEHPKEVINYQWYLFNKKFNKKFEEDAEEMIYDYDLNVIDAFDTAYVNYKMRPSDLYIHLFRVKERIYFIDDLKYLGWKQFAKGGVQTHDIEGDHKTLLLPPNNKALITKIETILGALN